MRTERRGRNRNRSGTWHRGARTARSVNTCIGVALRSARTRRRSRTMNDSGTRCGEQVGVRVEVRVGE